MKDFFISYNTADQIWANFIALTLKYFGYSTVMQHWDIQHRQNFVLQAQGAAEETAETIIVLTENYLQGQYLLPEWSAAVASGPLGQPRTLLPFRVQECHPTGILDQLVYVDLVGLSVDGAVDAIGRFLRGRKIPAESASFDRRLPLRLGEPAEPAADELLSTGEIRLPPRTELPIHGYQVIRRAEPPMAAPPAATQPKPAAALAGAEPPPRYADYTFYKQDKNGNRAERVLTQMPLKTGVLYQLEVAVRLKPTGITPAGERKPLREPKQKEPVEIIVTATSDPKEFVIPQPVQKLILPPTGDSVENAVFPGVEPRQPSAPGSSSSLRIRLYYKRNLLEVARLEAEVVGPSDPDTNSPRGLLEPIKLVQERLEQEYTDFDVIEPREMHIDVSQQRIGSIKFDFVFDRGKKNEIALAGSAEIGEQVLESTLLGIRKALQGITMWDEFGSGIEGKDEARFDAAMNKLARLGHSLRNTIFFRDEKSSIAVIGEWLQDNPLPLGCTIQVSVDADASSYIFPWSILYDKDVPEDKEEGPDLNAFWGLRYVIEQRIPGAQNGTDEAICTEGTLELGYLLSCFNEAIDQQHFLDGLVKQSQGRIGNFTPIDTRDTAYEYLQNCTSDIVYFFAHGHTQFLNANLYGFSSADFVKLYNTLPAASPLRASWAQICDDLTKGLYDSDESWIKLVNGKLLLETLYDPGRLQLHKHPVVFLNMCESAQVTPTAGSSFIHVFMNRGARDVLGTECSMRPFVAHRFASQFFEGLLSGTPIGQVLLDLRKEFIRRKNPLGLAYTLYGSATTKFQPPPLTGPLPASGAQPNQRS